MLLLLYLCIPTNLMASLTSHAVPIINRTQHVAVGLGPKQENIILF